MNNLILPIPLPDAGVTIRPGRADDVDFLDALQRKTTRQVGFMPRKQFEGKVAAGHVLIAEEGGSGEGERGKGNAFASPFPLSASPSRPVGYLIGNDQYFKHDDVGIIYQMNVVPERRRSLVAASLLQSQFARSAYGCKLYCCWCAQDIEANRFWEAMGFVPIAYRAGGVGKGKVRKGKGGSESSSLSPSPSQLSPSARVHIFWQKRIRQGDGSTPWWFPSLTSGGSLRADRIVLPIPPGTHWSEAKPLILPGAAGVDSGQLLVDGEEKNAPAPRKQRPKAATPSGLSTIHSPLSTPRVPTMGMGRLSFFEVPTPVTIAQVAAEKPKREKKPKQKHDPKLVSAARELRDRYLEHYNAQPMSPGAAKYEVGRTIESSPTPISLLSAA